jgi:hypothetical protein
MGADSKKRENVYIRNSLVRLGGETVMRKVRILIIALVFKPRIKAHEKPFAGDE